MKEEKKRGVKTTPPRQTINPSQRYKKQNFEQQFKLVKKTFSLNIYTMKTVSILTNIDRVNICRYVAKMRKENSIVLVKRGICPITKFRAGFYSTNLNLLTNEI